MVCLLLKKIQFKFSLRVDRIINSLHINCLGVKYDLVANLQCLRPFSPLLQKINEVQNGPVCASRKLDGYRYRALVLRQPTVLKKWYFKPFKINLVMKPIPKCVLFDS